MSNDSTTGDGAPRRVFLSYGHDEHAELAERLKHDLEQRGHEVWFDAERLEPGSDWESYIEEGLNWVAAEPPGGGRVVLLMTPYSVRRPDGFCLNEVARALLRHLTVVPVMVVWCQPPLSICRIQWLDMRDCVPSSTSEERYGVKLERLVEALEHDQLDYEGSQARLLHLLAPLSFDADLDWHVSRFTGRQWVVERIDAWLADADAERVLWLVGPHGVGKTTLAAWFCARRGDVAAFHLCRQGHARKADPRQCVLSLAYQLSTQVHAYEEALNALDLEQILREGSDAGTLFDDLLVQPLARLPRTPDRPLVIVVDAIDEATRGGRNELASFLATEFQRTPEWLRLIVTSSNEPEIMHALQDVSPITLDVAAEDNLQDIREYLRRELRIQGNEDVPESTIQTIVELSEGLFLYAELVRADLRSGRLSLDRLQEFPAGLGGSYARWVARQFPDLSTYQIRIRPVLEILGAMQDGLTIQTLSSLMGWDLYAQRDFQNAVGSLFVLVDNHVHPFHTSLLVWLTDQEKAGVYFVDVQKGHKVLADHGWVAYHGTDHIDPSVVMHLPLHLRLSGQLDRAFELFQEDRFLEDFMSMMSTNDLREELIACWRAAERLSLTAPLVERFPASTGLARGFELAKDGHASEAVAAFEAIQEGLSSGLAAVFWVGLAWLYKDHDTTEERRIVLQRGAAALRRAEPLFHNVRGAALWGEATRSLAWLLKDLEFFDEAEAAFHEARDIYERFEMERQVAWTQRDLGCFYRDTGRADDAEDQLRQALAVFSRLGDDRNRAITLKELGVLFLGLSVGEPRGAGGYLDEAMTSLQESRRIAHGVRVGDLNAWVMRYEGLAQALAGHLSEGRQLIRQARGQFEQFQSANLALSDFCVDNALDIRRPHLLELYGHLPTVNIADYGHLLESERASRRTAD